MKQEEKIKLVPVYRKCLLSLEEAVAFSGLGTHSLLMLADRQDLNLVVWSGRNGYTSVKNWRSTLKE